MRKSCIKKRGMENKDLFVFLEIFSVEGGIQSYVKDIMKAYISLATEGSGTTNDTGNSTESSSYGGELKSAAKSADVFLLRDDRQCENPFEGENTLTFHYFKTIPPWLGRLRLGVALLGHLLRKRPRQVFCGHVNLAPLVQILCEPLKIPYTVLTYGKEVWEPLPPKYRKALDRARRIWTISRYSRDRACQSNDLDPQKFQLLPCSVSGQLFASGSVPTHFIESYQLAGAKVLMTVARLWSGDIYKGVDVTIRAMPAIAEFCPNVKYLVVGRGDDKPRLAQLALDLGVADRVVFAGFVPSAELRNLYRVADAYIMPSQEGFGIVYLEAMACGIPVLAGDADGSADPLQDGKLGWRVPHRDPEAVAAACIEILKGNDRRCDGKWLREMTLAAFGTDAFTKSLGQLVDFYG